MKVFTTLVVGAVVIAAVADSSFANPTAYIDGTSTATQIVGGTYDGWYRYDMEIEWDLGGPGAGLSHWDLILKVECKDGEHEIVFDPEAGYNVYAGYSNNGLPPGPGSWEIGWTGYWVLNGDNSVTPAITDPIVKYENPVDLGGGDEPGAEGFGIFTFYANIIPEYGTYTDALVAKGGQVETQGDLEGAYPSCTIIPAPGAIVLGGIGIGFVGRLRRRKTL